MERRVFKKSKIKERKGESKVRKRLVGLMNEIIFCNDLMYFLFYLLNIQNDYLTSKSLIF